MGASILTDDKRLLFENAILDRLRGRVNLLQTQEVKDAVILEAIKDFCGSRHCRLPDCQNKCSLSDEDQRRFVKELQGYDVLETFLNDPGIEDVIINGTDPIHVHHADHGLIETDQRLATNEELALLIKKILVFAGRDDLKKINDVDLPGMRGRVNIVYSPFGSKLTITKTRTDPLSIIDLLNNETLNTRMAALLWLYIEGMGIKAANMLIVGGPGCGKTTLLNALLSFIPSSQHLVVIEDTFELVTTWIRNASRLESDEDLSLADLVKNSLRMRPERIVVGEVRGREAEDMITAMNIGKYCLGTIHASKTRDAILRLQSHPMNIPPALVNMVDVFIVVQKERRGERTVRVVSEITETAGMENEMVLISPVWQFDSAAHRFALSSPWMVFRDRLSRVSGIDSREIMAEVDRRESFLESLRQAGIRSAAEVAAQCESYLLHPREQADAALSSLLSAGE